MSKKAEETLSKFDDFLRYGTDEEGPKGPVSRRAYLYTAQLFINYLEGRAMTPDLGKQFIKSLEDRGNTASSINRHIWALKSFFRFKKKKLNIRGLKVQDKLPRVLTPDERDRLLSVAYGETIDENNSTYGRERARLAHALLYVYLGGGLRLSEGVRLKVTDVDEEGYLHITRKGGSEAYVPVEDVVIDVLKKYIETNTKNGYVFPGREPNTHISARSAQAIIKELCIQAGLPDVHVHTLRHTVGTEYRRLGTSERDIQDLLGHKNIQTTKRYTTLAREDLRQRLPGRMPKRIDDARQGKLIV